MGQTTVQDDESVMFGSAKIELGLYKDGLAGLVDIGAATASSSRSARSTRS